MCIHPANIYRVPTRYQALVLSVEVQQRTNQKNAHLRGAGMEVGETDDKEINDLRLENDKCLKKNKVG